MGFHKFHKYLKDKYILVWKRKKNTGERWNEKQREGIFG